MATVKTKTSRKTQAKKPIATPPEPVELVDVPEPAPVKTAHYIGYGALLLVAMGSLVAGAWIAHKGQAMGWEHAWFTYVNNWTDALNVPMQCITFFGSTLAVLGTTVVAFLLRCYQFAWRFAFTALGAYTVVAALKHFVGRERPIGLFQDIHLRATETGAGFPSGHATIITVFMLTLAPFIPRAWRWLVALPIVAVCLSRLYLGVHVPLDVIGGLAIGTAAVAFVQLLPIKLRELLRL